VQVPEVARERRFWEEAMGTVVRTAIRRVLCDNFVVRIVGLGTGVW